MPTRFSGSDIFELATHFVRRTVRAVFTAIVDISVGGTGLLIGADSGLTTRTDGATKVGRLALAHYTNAEEPIGLIAGTSTATTTTVFVGGGSGAQNTATSLYFYTAATTTTTTGSRRLVIDENGNVSIGGQLPVSKFDVHDALGAVLTLRRQDTSVTAGDMVGKIQFYAADTSTTTNFVVADIEAQATNTVASDINPGRLIFRTTGTGVAATPTERMRIDEAGDITLADTTDIIISATTGSKIGTATGQKLAFWGQTPAARPAAYTVTNHTDDRTLDETGNTLPQVANVLGTLINDLKAIGLIG